MTSTIRCDNRCFVWCTTYNPFIIRFNIFNIRYTFIRTYNKILPIIICRSRIPVILSIIRRCRPCISGISWNINIITISSNSCNNSIIIILICIGRNCNCSPQTYWCRSYNPVIAIIIWYIYTIIIYTCYKYITIVITRYIS